MRPGIRVLAIAAFLCLAAVLSSGVNPQKTKSLAIDHVTVIDVDGGPELADQTVIVKGDSISAVAKSGSVEIPKDAQRIDARGKFLIPGLWDMHTHIAGINANPVWAKQTLLPLLVANGITGIRDMGGDLDASRELAPRNRERHTRRPTDRRRRADASSPEATWRPRGAS